MRGFRYFPNLRGHLDMHKKGLLNVSSGRRRAGEKISNSLFCSLLSSLKSIRSSIWEGSPPNSGPHKKKPMEHAAHNPNFKTWIIAASVQFEQCQERNVKFAGIDSSGTARYDLKWSGYICKCSFAHSDNFVSTSTLSQVRLELHFLNSPRSRSSGGLWRPAPPRPRPGGPTPPSRRIRPLQENFFKNAIKTF